jgi:hypothetical protein
LPNCPRSIVRHVDSRLDTVLGGLPEKVISVESDMPIIALTTTVLDGPGRDAVAVYSARARLDRMRGDDPVRAVPGSGVMASRSASAQAARRRGI